MKHVKISAVFIPFLMVGCLEIETLTRIHPDGSIERVLDLKGSTEAIFETSFNIPRADVSLWEVSLDSIGDEKHLYHATRTFNTVAELNQSFEMNTGPLRFKAKSELTQSQGLFFSRYFYTEKLWVDLPGPKLSMEGFLSESELQKLIISESDESDVDSLEAQRLEDQFDRYLEQRIFEDFVNELRLGALQTGKADELETVIAANRDSLIIKLGTTNYYNENEVWQTIMGAYFEASPSLLDDIHEKNSSGFEGFYQRWGFFEEVLINDYSFSIEMPGVIRKTSAIDVRGNRMNWEPNVIELFFGGATLEAESSVVKVWPLLFTGVLFLLTLMVSVASFVRQRKASGLIP